MPSFARELEQTLHNALGEASKRRHEYATLEHLLIALVDDEHASKVMTACGVSRDELRASVKQYLDNELGALVADSATDPTPTSGFQRVVQRAILHVQSSGRDEVTGANVLVALFSERESYAVYFLQQQDMSRLDAVTYISHGVGKGETPVETRAPEGTEEKTEKEGGKKESALKQFTVDLNEKAKAGKVDPLIGRMPEVDRTVQILCRRSKNNPLYVGDPGVGKLLQFRNNGLQALLEIAPVAGTGQQGAHIERVDRRRLEHVGNVALDDLARQAFRDRGFADTGLADVKRVVLRPAAEDLHGALDFRHPADERIDFSGPRLLVEIDRELFEGAFLLALLLGLFLIALGRPRLGRGVALADAVADVSDRIQPAHVLLLQEIDGIAFTLGEEGDEDVGAGHLVSPGGLDVEDRSLDHALEPACRSRVGAAVGDERSQLVVEIMLHGSAKLVAVDPAGGHHLGGMFVVDQRDQ